MRITETDGVYAISDVSPTYSTTWEPEKARVPQTLDPWVTIFLNITLLRCAKAQNWAPQAAEMRDDSSPWCTPQA